MGAKQVVIGLVIFIIVIITSFVTLNHVLQLSEAMSVIIAIVIGFGAEFLYRRKS